MDEQIPTAPAVREDMPALVLMPNCTPWVLFSSKIDGVHNGFEALRDTMGQWSVRETPFDFASAGLVMDKSGTLFALPTDGAFGTSLWRFSADNWVKVNDVPELVAHDAHGVVMDANGTIHAAFRTPQYDIMLGHFNGTWALSKIASNGAWPTVALSPEGVPHVAWVGREDAASTSSYHWQSPPLDAQLVKECLGKLDCGNRAIKLAVTAADETNPRGRPHLLAHLYHGGGTFPSMELRYMTTVPSSGAGSNEWLSFAAAGDIGVDVYPLGAIRNDTGDVRFFYSSRGHDPNKNLWDLVVAWREGDEMKATTVWSSPQRVWTASFALDGAGNVHIAMYVHADVGYDVRYVVLGI